MRQAGVRCWRALGEQLDDLAHDPVDVEVLRRVDPRDAGLAQRGDVGEGDDAADHDRGIDAVLAQQPHGLGDQLEVRAGEDRKADDVDVLVARRGRDLLGREADALVDHLHADITGTNRDLLGAVGMPVEPGLADEDARAVADPLGERVDALADRAEKLLVGAG